MKNFWVLLSESVIIQAILALITVGSVIYLLVIGKEVPKELWSLVGLILGFYFGTKSQQVIQSYIRNKMSDSEE